MSACDGVDFVMNEAAWESVLSSIEMPLYYELVNIRGTLNMMEAARQKGIKNLYMLQALLYMVITLCFPKRKEIYFLRMYLQSM